jgi:hypothetical protein
MAHSCQVIKVEHPTLSRDGTADLGRAVTSAGVPVCAIAPFSIDNAVMTMTALPGRDGLTGRRPGVAVAV